MRRETNSPPIPDTTHLSPVVAPEICWAGLVYYLARRDCDKTPKSESCRFYYSPLLSFTRDAKKEALLPPHTEEFNLAALPYAPSAQTLLPPPPLFSFPFRG